MGVKGAGDGGGRGRGWRMSRPCFILNIFYMYIV